MKELAPTRWASDWEWQLPFYRAVTKEMIEIHKQSGRHEIDPNNIDYETGLYWGRGWEYPWAIETAELEEDMKVLDVGCGMSPFLIYLGKAGLKCYGVDPDNVIHHDGLWGYDKNFGKPYILETRKENMSEISFPDNFFDRVFCLSVMEHLKKGEVIEGLKQMKRVLKPGGLLLITVDLGLHKWTVLNNVGMPPHGEVDYYKYPTTKNYNILGMVFKKRKA